jgi:8-amino-7-oxononanoate synthase
MNFPEKLNRKLLKRKDSNNLRVLCSQHELIDFSSNDYLGFSKNEQISINTRLHLQQFSNINGSTGSRLLSGNHQMHEEVENELAVFFNASNALIFNSGYDANVGVLSSIPQHGDLVLFDELCHASIRDGIRLSHAKAYSFGHNDLNDLEKKYANTHNSNGNTYVIVESIYSMDGDAAPLKSMVDFCKRNACYLIVDEAHSTGLFGESGRGIVVELGLEEEVFARIHTFGKALGCHGAVVVGQKELMDYLINYASSFIYTTSLPLHSILTIKYAIKELRSTEELNKLKTNIAFFRNELQSLGLKKMFINSESAIQSCLIPNVSKIKEIAQNIRQQGYDVKAILSPTVPEGKERLRFCIHSYNSAIEIKDCLKLLNTLV